MSKFEHLMSRWTYLFSCMNARISRSCFSRAFICTGENLVLRDRKRRGLSDRNHPSFRHSFMEIERFSRQLCCPRGQGGGEIKAHVQKSRTMHTRDSRKSKRGIFNACYSTRKMERAPRMNLGCRTRKTSPPNFQMVDILTQY